MIDRIKNIIYNQKYLVLGILLYENETKYKLLEVSFKSNDIKINQSHSYKKKTKKLQKKLKTNLPIILHIEGYGVLSKSIENEMGFKQKLIFNADISDFYFYEYHEDKTVHVSTIRKTTVETIIDEIKLLNPFLVNLTFGPFVLANLFKDLKDHRKLESLLQEIEIEDGKIQGIEKKLSSRNYSIHEDLLKGSELALLASFVDHIQQIETIFFENNFTEKNKSEHKFRHKYKIAIVATAIFFLISLSTSHILLNNYNGRIIAHSEKYNNAIETGNKSNALKSELELKRNILEVSDLNNQNYLAKYFMEIGNSVKEKITISQLSVNPIRTKITDGKTVKFSFGKILVKGYTIDDSKFNDWIKSLRDINWIKKIEIESYEENKDEKNTFHIELFY